MKDLNFFSEVRDTTVYKIDSLVTSSFYALEVEIKYLSATWIFQVIEYKQTYNIQQV